MRLYINIFDSMFSSKGGVYIRALSRECMSQYLFVECKLYFLRFFLLATLSIMGSFTLFATLLFWAINSLYLSPPTWIPFLFTLYLSLLQKLPRSP